MEIMKCLRRWVGAVVCVYVLFVLAGCASDGDTTRFDPMGMDSGGAQIGTNGSSGMMTDISGYRLQVGDELTIGFPDLQNPPPPITDPIHEDGTITLFFSEKFQAAGRTVGQLKDDIHSRYVPKYFQYGTPSLKLGDRFYHLTGEVRSPGRQVYVGKTTVTKAIATAGGLTEFARHGTIQVTRADGKKITVDYDKALSDARLDLEIFPGDQVHVSKRIW